MTLRRQLITSKKNTVEITSDDATVEQHFANPASYADVVLNEFNTDRSYDHIFQGGEDLTILDIGANIGLFSLYIHERAKNVYAIEPTPGHFGILSKLTNGYPNITCINAALHNIDGPIDFFINNENSTMNSTTNRYGVKTTVDGVTIASLLDRLNLNQVDFVKCDIEGSEMTALTDETIGAVRDRIRIWYIECHATDHSRWQESTRYNRSMMATMFVRQGYQVHLLKNDTLYAYKD
jgi:hypothetical protein